MNGPTPLVSIIIPAYNHARYLDEAIQSVLVQDYPNIELIVLDDGSTDGTRDVLDKYSGKFFWESQPNMGQAETLNKGWRLSKGEVLAYLSADDVLKPQAASSSVKALAANPQVVLTYCDFNLIDPNSTVIRRVSTPEYNYHDMVTKLVCAPGPGVFFKRSAFERAGLWNGSLRQIPDYEYWLRLGLQGRFQRVQEVLADYRVHDDSQSFARVDELRANEVLCVMSNFFETQQVPPEVLTAKNQALSNAHLIAARLHLRAGRFGHGLQNLWHAAVLFPRNYLVLRTYLLITNALFNRLGHKFVWAINRLRARWHGP